MAATGVMEKPFKPGDKVCFKHNPGAGMNPAARVWEVRSCELNRVYDRSNEIAELVSRQNHGPQQFWVVHLVGFGPPIPAEDLELVRQSGDGPGPVLDQKLIGALNATLMTMRPALVDMAIGYMRESEHGRLEPETIIKILEALKELVDETHKARQVLEEAKREVDNAYRASQGAFRRLGEVVGANLGLDEGDD